MTENNQVDKRCFICKYHDKLPGILIEKTKVYTRNGFPISIYLCRNHSSELFKKGQRDFFCKYYYILGDVIGTSDQKLIVLMHEIVKKHLSSIY